MFMESMKSNSGTKTGYSLIVFLYGLIKRKVEQQNNRTVVTHLQTIVYLSFINSGTKTLIA